MANNRMFLLCNICCPEFKEVPLKGGYMIGKWYPGTDYGGRDFSGLNDFLEEHSHGGLEYPLRLEYEVEKTAEDYFSSLKN